MGIGTKLLEKLGFETTEKMLLKSAEQAAINAAEAEAARIAAEVALKSAEATAKAAAKKGAATVAERQAAELAVREATVTAQKAAVKEAAAKEAASVMQKTAQKEAEQVAKKTAEKQLHRKGLRRGAAAGLVGGAAGGGYLAYDEGQDNPRRDEQGRPIPISPSGKAKQFLQDLVEGEKPILGQGSLIGAALLGGLSMVFVQWPLAIVMAVVGAIGGQMLWNEYNPPTKTDPAPGANVAAGGKPDVTPETNVTVNPQAKTAATDKASDYIASITTDSLGNLSQQGIPAKLADNNKQKSNPLKSQNNNSLA